MTLLGFTFPRGNFVPASASPRRNTFITPGQASCQAFSRSSPLRATVNSDSGLACRLPFGPRPFGPAAVVRGALGGDWRLMALTVCACVHVNNSFRRVWHAVCNGCFQRRGRGERRRPEKCNGEKSRPGRRPGRIKARCPPNSPSPELPHPLGQAGTLQAKICPHGHTTNDSKGSGMQPARMSLVLFEP